MVRKCLLLLVVLLTACSSPPEPAAPSPAAPSSAPPPVATGPATYVALGDSVAAGVGAASPATGGYVPLLADLLSVRLGCGGSAAPGCPLQLRNLAVGGATTADLLRDQLPAAVALMAGADVQLVTVTIGGNDVVEPVLRGCAPDPDGAACAQAVDDALQVADAGLDRLLRDLAEAAGRGATVAVTTYANPVPACRLVPLLPLAERVLEGGPDRPGLNDVVRTRAAENGVVVVDVAGLLLPPRDFVGGEDCLHPSGSGHERIAAAVAAAVSEAVVGG